MCEVENFNHQFIHFFRKHTSAMQALSIK